MKMKMKMNMQVTLSNWSTPYFDHYKSEIFETKYCEVFCGVGPFHFRLYTKALF